MSRLAELIKEHCPEGCEYVPIWQVTIWNKKFKAVEKSKQAKVINYPYLLSNDLFALELEKGNVFLLSTGEEIGWTSEKLAGNNLCEGEVVAIPGGGRANTMKYYKGKFVTGDNRIATSSNTSILLNKYLYYWFLSKVDIIDSFYRGAGIKHPNMNEILNMQIPLPSLPVQEEIVRILDNFTELAQELTLRKKQYEYYRDKLLNFENAPYKVEYKRLGEIGRVSMCKRIMKHETNQKEGVPFYKIGTFGEKADSYISNELFDKYKKEYPYPKKGAILISASGTIGKTVIFDGKPAYFQDSNIVWIDNDETQVLNKFLYYYYQLKPWNIATGGTINRLYNDNLNKTVIPLPPLSEQERIVNILDRFDALCNDLTRGIPAEIEARRKQYEYYRDKLLTFKAV